MNNKAGKAAISAVVWIFLIGTSLFVLSPLVYV